ELSKSLHQPPFSALVSSTCSSISLILPQSPRKISSLLGAFLPHPSSTMCLEKRRRRPLASSSLSLLSATSFPSFSLKDVLSKNLLVKVYCLFQRYSLRIGPSMLLPPVSLNTGVFPSLS